MHTLHPIIETVNTIFGLDSKLESFLFQLPLWSYNEF